MCGGLKGNCRSFVNDQLGSMLLTKLVVLSMSCQLGLSDSNYVIINNSIEQFREGSSDIGAKVKEGRDAGREGWR